MHGTEHREEGLQGSSMHTPGSQHLAVFPAPEAPEPCHSGVPLEILFFGQGGITKTHLIKSLAIGDFI